MDVSTHLVTCSSVCKRSLRPSFWTKSDHTNWSVSFSLVSHLSSLNSGASFPTKPNQLLYVLYLRTSNKLCKLSLFSVRTLYWVFSFISAKQTAKSLNYWGRNMSTLIRGIPWYSCASQNKDKILVILWWNVFVLGFVYIQKLLF